MPRIVNKLAKRTALGGALAAALWLLAGYALAPWLIERTLARYAASSPARALTAERVAFDPFTLTATLTGLDASEADVRLTAARARVNLSVASLLRWAPTLDAITLERARVALAGPELGPDWRERIGALVAARTRALPDLVVAELALNDATLVVTAADGETERFAARVSLTASEIVNAAGALAIGTFEFDAREADGIALELAGRVAREPTVVSGRFALETLEIARLADWLGGALGARAPSGVLGMRGEYALSGGRTFRTLQLSDATAGVAEPSFALADGGAVSARRLDAGIDAEIDLAARRARATGRVELSGPTLSRAAETAALGAERVTVENVTLTLPDGELAAADARVEGWRARVDLTAGAPRLPAWALTIDEVELARGSLGIADAAAPGFELRVEDATGRLAGFEAAGLPREIELEGRIGDTESGRLRAQLTRTGPARYGRADVSVDALPAATLSPYAERFAGWRLDAGTVNVSLRYRGNGRVAGFGDWRIDGLMLGRVADAPAADAAATEDGVEPLLGAENPARSESADETTRNDAAIEDHADAVDAAAALPLALAAALETDAAGRIEISVPLDASADVPVPYLPGLAGRALARHVTEAARAPFGVLARLVDAEADALAAVPFEAGSAELSAAADGRLRSLAQALAQRPRLMVGAARAYAAAADREALAAEQVRVHVALATAEAARGGPTGPLDFASPRVQDVLDEFAGQRLTASVREDIAARFAFVTDAPPSERAPYYEAVFAALTENEPVTDQMRNRLARYRALAIAGALEAHGLDPARIAETDAAREAGVGDDEVLVPLTLAAPTGP